MRLEKTQAIKRLVKKIPGLTAGQIYWLDEVVRVFESEHRFQASSTDLFAKDTLDMFGDTLRIHHCFSVEPFSKDKFEYVLEQVLNLTGHKAALAPKGNRGHDITIDDCKVSLKTQADKSIRDDRIWISKFMELGRGRWGDNPADLAGLREMFIRHLDSYERILILRALARGPRWRYELVEVPKDLLQSALDGQLVMKSESRQFPKPGYCYVRSPNGEDKFCLYFDGGTERKLQIKNLNKDLCRIHADWRFTIPEGQN